MRAYILPSGRRGIDQLRLADVPSLEPEPDEVVIRLEAASLNSRDLAIVNGTYFADPGDRDLIPLSDGAGEVVSVGHRVQSVKVGNRVACLFFQPVGNRRAALGLPRDGVLREEIALREEGVVPIPHGYSAEEAACLPCAALTAWHALMRAGRPTRSGDTVLVMGTGGVSSFALQFARVLGARVIATSSSDEKLERSKALGAETVINYKKIPRWEREVLNATDGRGVDCVVEVGGAGTLKQSIQCLANGGKVSLVGFLADGSRDAGVHQLVFKSGHICGISVGDRPMFEEMSRAIEANGIKPVIDRVFEFDDAVSAFEHYSSYGFVGKVVIRI